MLMTLTHTQPEEGKRPRGKRVKSAVTGEARGQREDGGRARSPEGKSHQQPRRFCYDKGTVL